MENGYLKHCPISEIWEEKYERCPPFHEILSVGNESFQNKSGKALMELIKSGVTTVYVSDSVEAARSVCDKVIWLEHA